MSTRPILWKSEAPDPLSLSNPTFAAQSYLQKLPVPDMIATFTRLKESLKPIAWSDEEYAAAEKKIDSFANSPLARELHARLLKRAQESSHWLEEWWDDAGYLAYRDSVCLFC
jgi:carnitine O-acetyltransferase